MINLVQEAKECLDVFRWKAENKQYDLKQNEKVALARFYTLLNLELFNKKKTLAIGCSACIVSAINQAHNYIKFHEVKTPIKTEKPANITIVNPKMNRNEMIELLKSKKVAIPRNATVKQLRELL
jgi:hypothetical protein